MKCVVPDQTTKEQKTEISGGDHEVDDNSVDKFPLDSQGTAKEEDVKEPDNSDKDISYPELQSLVTKLAPLANVEVETITKLAQNIERLTKLSLVPENDHKSASVKEDTAKTKDFDLNTLLFSCHSIIDITTKFQEFEYSAELDGMVCSVCKSQNAGLKQCVFTYERELEQDFTGPIQIKKFGNLKSILNGHLKTLCHQKSMEEVTNKANIKYKEDTRNKAVAMKIGRIAYFLIKAGRPDTDFTTLIYLHSANSCTRR